MMTGGCVQTPINDSGPCDDFDGCTAGDSCNAGMCAPGTAVAGCTDDDGCCGPTCDSTTDNDCQSILLFGENLPAAGWNAYRNALTAAGRQWDENDYNQTGTFPDAATLSGYDTLIMVLESQSPSVSGGGWPESANFSVVNWLQAGGERNLLVIGKDFVFDYQDHIGTCEHDPCDVGGPLTLGCAKFVSGNSVNGACSNTVGDPTCCTTSWTAGCVSIFEGLTNEECPNGEVALFNLLGITFVNGSAGNSLNLMQGVAADPITDPFDAEPMRLSGDLNSSGDYADPTQGPATHVGFYTSDTYTTLDRSAIARYAPSYQSVWIGFNLHDGVVEAPQRNALMVRIMEWFKG
jgi:hypothetical protein